jgi:DNA-binding response OmpR family regulator
MRILFIEDDKNIAATLTDALSWHFIVDNAYRGSEALELLFQNAYDLILLDYTLPDIEGPLLYKQIRAVDQSVKVLVLTGNDTPEDKVQMLDAGADDYVTKPYHLNELMARIRVILRRGPAQHDSTVLDFEDLEMDIAKRTVKRGEQDIKLRRKEFDLLEYMMRNKGRVVTRDMIFNHVWETPQGSTNVVDVHIKNLRDRVDKPFDQSLIQTVPGVGYKLDTYQPPKD